MVDHQAVSEISTTQSKPNHLLIFPFKSKAEAVKRFFLK